MAEGRTELTLSVMVLRREERHPVVFHQVDEPVLLIDAPRPQAGEIAFERLWLAQALKGMAADVIY